MIRHYLADRLVFILIYFINTAVTVLVAFLALMLAGLAQPWNIFAYMVTLAVFFLLTGLAIDYIRKRPYLKKLASMGEDQSLALDTALELEAMPMPTHEAAMFTDMLRRSQARYREDLDHYKALQNRHQTFVNQWVHHMKTPVSVVSLLTQQGKQQHDDQDAKVLFDDISDENDRFRHGLELMLHLARLDHFAIDFVANQVDVVQLMRDIVNEEKRQFIRRKIYPEIRVETDDAIVYSDEKWLRVIFHQLLLNALRYSHQGSGDYITIVVHKQGDATLVEVRDQGIGIPAHDVPNIFSPFFTGDNGRQKKESTGMGLYLSRMIASHLGHSLYAESRVDKGTTMTVRFTSRTLHER
ncbi:HAMP domain-containing histidine kinase [Salicibibacter halophilus]|uniref:histidine kinase n=1 Tax=Salicibibacter halophilus TaxID=2502791 RepID=A0A514LLV5_9BACI|nr:sensor histidine kinase [Salicibibacter halophilus]QDI92241.1 HAMP domain-containing histidine kinase [Salicibibacter halophilus]